ncbi:Hypothetical protein LUCI_4418 [Lucifera butyrica]|uniref:Uncharacterized protein n=1 Tax=Lucifera butyrica TaxID=1351585 RepID=A0A498RGD0_9FIRM|nr:hypothetical protein [Lucifera butyrica]VBB09132.1 Hypothetical protein LUCI_4418 [Lucifera butyrica]
MRARKTASPLEQFLRLNFNQYLVFQTGGNPFLIGKPTGMDCNIVIVLEAAGYTTYIPLREIVEVHTAVI